MSAAFAATIPGGAPGFAATVPTHPASFAATVPAAAEPASFASSIPASAMPGYDATNKEGGARKPDPFEKTSIMRRSDGGKTGQEP